MNSSRTLRQRSPTPISEDMGEETDLLSNPTYDITGDVSRFTTQYYHTVEPQDTTLSPKVGSSSSESSSSGGSKSASTSSDEGPANGGDRSSPQIHRTLTPTMEYTVTESAEHVASPVVSTICTAAVPSNGIASSSSESSSVKHWSYEEQFKQVGRCCMVHAVVVFDTSVVLHENIVADFWGVQ